MRDSSKYSKDDLVPKGFLYAVFGMAVLSLFLVFFASLFQVFHLPLKSVYCLL